MTHRFPRAVAAAIFLAFVALAAPLDALAELTQPGGMLELGKVAEGVVKEFYLPISNAGPETIHLDRIEAGCYCTTPGLMPSSVKAGETVQIPLAFDSTGMAGELERTVSIYVAGNPEPALMAVYTVTIEPRFSTVPETVDFAIISPMAFEQRKFIVKRVAGTGTLKDVVINDERLFATAKALGDDRWEVTIHTAPNAAPGSFMAIVVVKTTDPLREELAVLATGEFR